MKRPDKSTYFMWMAVVASTRSTCNRRSVGCVIVDECGRVLATGYNGSSPGDPHCDAVGHLMHKGSCVRTTHAETNAIGYAARAGVPLNGSIAYITCHPCPNCLKLLIATGVNTVVYLEEYHREDDDVSSHLAGKHISLFHYKGPRPWDV